MLLVQTLARQPFKTPEQVMREIYQRIVAQFPLLHHKGWGWAWRNRRMRIGAKDGEENRGREQEEEQEEEKQEDKST